MTPLYSRTNPFPGKMLVNRRVNEGNRNKETRHHEISLTGSGLTFEPGDSMAVYATNDPPLVEEIIRALGSKVNPEPVSEISWCRVSLFRFPSFTRRLTSILPGNGLVREYNGVIACNYAA